MIFLGQDVARESVSLDVTVEEIRQCFNDLQRVSGKSDETTHRLLTDVVGDLMTWIDGSRARLKETGYETSSLVCIECMFCRIIHYALL